MGFKIKFMKLETPFYVRERKNFKFLEFNSEYDPAGMIFLNSTVLRLIQKKFSILINIR